jgi:molybdopterin converting factor small subunit
MSVKVEITGAFRKYLNNEKTVEVECSSLGECLEKISRAYPETRGMFMTDEGKLLNRFEIFINSRSIFPGGTDTPLKHGDKVDLVYIVHGG